MHELLYPKSRYLQDTLERISFCPLLFEGATINFLAHDVISIMQAKSDNSLGKMSKIFENKFSAK